MDATPLAGPTIEGFFDPATGTISYVFADPATRRAAIVDPVLGYDFKSGTTDTELADRMIGWIEARGLGVDWILETHAHADHLSAAPYLKRRLGGRTAIGKHIREVQSVFQRLFNLDARFAADGRQFDRLLDDGETFRVGSLNVTALWVPGHTPADLAYRVGDAAVFVGDTLFMPDVGTARADFPGGDAATLYRSIRRLLELPPATRLFVCHDYPPAARAPRWQTTVAEQRAGNIHVRDGVTEAEFVAMRTARDKTLGMPTLILPSIQVNIRGGEFPEPEGNGVAYLKVPLNALPR
jgi:glyoxylase-like metal-dependent hydrolase (beta-lactamase superfamily II)